MSNKPANDWIRDRWRTGSIRPTVRSSPPQQQQPAAPRRVPGNAGAGTGSPPPSAPPSVNDWIRAASGRFLRW